MTPDAYARASAVELRDGVAAGRWTRRDIAAAALEHIALHEPRIHAWQFLAAGPDAVAAGGADAGGALLGVPVAVKDIIATRDMPTEFGSPIYRGHRTEGDAECVARVRAAGALLPGKTVTTEFAYFAPGPTANPHHTGHTPGGSSSGSAAAVASGMVPLAFGSQTAGSLIRPASYCGVFGLKPTFGALSLAGVKPFAPSLDTLGWLARSCDDLELMRCALVGEAWQRIDGQPATAPRLGVCHTHEWDSCDADGASAFERGAAAAAREGLRLVPRELPDALAGLLACQKTVMAFEAARSLHEEHLRHAARMSPALLDLLERGRAIPQRAYEAALAEAAAGRAAVERLMDGVDALLVPAAPGEAPAGLAATGDPVFSRVWTLLGLPCVSVPGLTGSSNLPIGLQLVGHPHRERELLQVAASLHRALRQ